MLLIEDLSFELVPLLNQLHIVRVHLLVPLAVDYELIRRCIYSHHELALSATPFRLIRRDK